MQAQAPQPTLFIPHGGGPCFFMDWDPPHTWDEMATFLRSIPSLLPQPPAAIIVISAHWQTRGAIEVTSAANPPLIYDYSGFPAHTYAIQYPAPGHPQLAGAIVQALQGAGLKAQPNPARGFDHGLFIPLKVAFPHANIPMVQVSLDEGLNPAHHLAIGQALAPFRNQNILIIASGMSYHNMRGLFGARGAKADSEAFTAWLAHAVTQPAATRNTLLENWQNAPASFASHPEAEHLLPLMVAAGAAGTHAGRTLYQGYAMGVQLAAFGFGL